MYWYLENGELGLQIFLRNTNNDISIAIKIIGIEYSSLIHYNFNNLINSYILDNCFHCAALRPHLELKYSTRQ